MHALNSQRYTVDDSRSVAEPPYAGEQGATADRAKSSVLTVFQTLYEKDARRTLLLSVHLSTSARCFLPARTDPADPARARDAWTRGRQHRHLGVSPDEMYGIAIGLSDDTYATIYRATQRPASTLLSPLHEFARYESGGKTVYIWCRNDRADISGGSTTRQCYAAVRSHDSGLPQQCN
ncbi:uncharacterized protein B0H18DRAFT_963631 [Fomitopsis serialis]|uniref:uncharacterized protein n=1 Tax=Fomitopsis serialis TaxID=139415 RepID=UPI002008BF85|nr:uncharacterized protein B0H18DRAFT_963631 [Neoantrodia serialis]KAH9910222.1 hypothetical protein B0H18DRAFT_963631 [Neoantrodia serialis]